jgi:hypothetical protein
MYILFADVLYRQVGFSQAFQTCQIRSGRLTAKLDVTLLQPQALSRVAQICFPRLNFSYSIAYSLHPRARISAD